MIQISEKNIRMKEGFLGQRMIVIPPNIAYELRYRAHFSSFYITACGYYPHAKHHYRKRDEGSGEYILLYCVAGRGEIHLLGKTILLKPNQFFIIPKNTAHCYYSNKEDPWSIYWLHFSGEHANYLYEKYVVAYPYQPQLQPYNEQNINLFLNAVTILEHSLGLQEAVAANISFLSFLGNLVYNEAYLPNEMRNDTINNSIRFMNQSYRKNLSLDDLAGHENLSVSYYSELFKNKIGFSPIRFFIQIKVQKSCQYLYFTDRSIKEISNLLGFEDPFYFSRIFKKIMGVSPIQYRKQQKTHR